MTHLRIIPLLALFILGLFAVPAVAQEADASVEADVSASVDLSTRPLDLIKARAREIKESAQDATLQLKTKTQMQLDAAETPGDRKQIMRGAVDARIDIAQDRSASSSQLARGIRAIVLTHGGVIKNRFRLAISHMNNIVGRIDSRLGKMAAAGIDTAAAAKLKVDAELAVDKAEADAQAVADFVATVADSSDRAAVRAELEAKLATANASLKAAHQAVMKAVRALVALTVDNKNKSKVDASATTSTSVQ